MMEDLTRMLETHPRAKPSEALSRCIAECFSCAETCTSCADACLAEERVQELVRCIRLNLDCADVCEVTGRVLTRQTAFEPGLALLLLQACAEACRVCGDECERHAEHHEHCRVCADACRRCQQACEEALTSIA
jgi:hypothetical protein